MKFLVRVIRGCSSPWEKQREREWEREREERIRKRGENWGFGGRPLTVAAGHAAEEGEVRGFAKNGVVNYFSKCSRSDSRLSFLPRPFRVEASRGRWLFQFPGVPTRLNFYRRRRRRRRRRRLAADHFARYRVTGLCLRKWLRASRFFSVMLLSSFPIMFSFSPPSLHAPTFSSVYLFSLRGSFFLSPRYQLSALSPQNYRSMRRIKWMLSRWSIERPRIVSRWQTFIASDREKWWRQIASSSCSSIYHTIRYNLNLRKNPELKVWILVAYIDY